MLRIKGRRVFELVFAVFLSVLLATSVWAEGARGVEQKIPSGLFYRFGMQYLSFRSMDKAYADFSRFYPACFGVGYKIANSGSSTLSISVDRSFLREDYIMPVSIEYDWYVSRYYGGDRWRKLFIGVSAGYLFTDLNTYLNEGFSRIIYAGRVGLDISQDVFWELLYSSYYTPHYQYYVDHWEVAYGHKF